MCTGKEHVQQEYNYSGPYTLDLVLGCGRGRNICGVVVSFITQTAISAQNQQNQACPYSYDTDPTADLYGSPRSHVPPGVTVRGKRKPRTQTKSTQQRHNQTCMLAGITSSQNVNTLPPLAPPPPVPISPYLRGQPTLSDLKRSSWHSTKYHG